MRYPDVRYPMAAPRPFGLGLWALRVNFSCPEFYEVRWLFRARVRWSPDAAIRSFDDGSFLDSVLLFAVSLAVSWPRRDLGWPVEVLWVVVVASSAFLTFQAFAPVAG